MEVDLEAYRSCTACSLHETRTQVVVGNGDPYAAIAIVCEAPGKVEDEVGRPLMGKAGKKLDMLLSQVGLQREDLFLCNVVSCRPPGNKLDSAPDAVVICPDLWLYPQLQSLRNLKVVVVMGETAGRLWFSGYKATEMATLARNMGDYIVVGARHPAATLYQGGLEEGIIRSLRRAILYSLL